MHSPTNLFNSLTDKVSSLITLLPMDKYPPLLTQKGPHPPAPPLAPVDSRPIAPSVANFSDMLHGYFVKKVKYISNIFSLAYRLYQKLIYGAGSKQLGMYFSVYDVGNVKISGFSRFHIHERKNSICTVFRFEPSLRPSFWYS
jgi:hypothetical protein